MHRTCSLHANSTLTLLIHPSSHPSSSSHPLFLSSQLTHSLTNYSSSHNKSDLLTNYNVLLINIRSYYHYHFPLSHFYPTPILHNLHFLLLYHYSRVFCPYLPCLSLTLSTASRYSRDLSYAFRATSSHRILAYTLLNNSIPRPLLCLLFSVVYFVSCSPTILPSVSASANSPILHSPAYPVESMRLAIISSLTE